MSRRVRSRLITLFSVVIVKHYFTFLLIYHTSLASQITLAGSRNEFREGVELRHLAISWDPALVGIFLKTCIHLIQFILKKTVNAA